jgi:MoaA/NifB/PqqE/SkfB family radical SAM enzyme
LGKKGLYLVRTNAENDNDGKPNARKAEVLPFQITMDVSAYCNARCPFCPRESLPMDPKLLRGFMKKEMFYDIMRQVQEMPSIKTISFGSLGEPLTHPDIDEFVDYTAGLGYRVMFPSNMALAHRHFDTLMKLDNIMLSIEGHDKESYESLRRKLKFDVVYENVKRFDELVREKKAKGERTPLRVLNFIVNRKSNIKAYLDLWGDFADDIRIGPMGNPLAWDKDKNQFISAPIKEMEDDILPLLTRVEDMQCVQPTGIITVRADGKLVLCCSDTGTTLDLGDSANLKESFYHNANLNRIREEFRTKKLHNCENCFQNYGITKDQMMEFLPQLRDIKDERVTVYFNR